MKQQIAHSLIAGVNGFVGSHLARSLRDSGCRVTGIGRDASPSGEVAELLDNYISADLAKGWPELPDVDIVINLAGLAAVGPSFDNPQLYIDMNSAIVTNLCEYYLLQAKSPRIIHVSSGAIYDSNQSLPIAEDAAISMSSPYVVSKVLTENQCTYYRARGIDCVVVRPFNHIGPGQGPGFILPDFYERIALVDDGATITVGNINTSRDYTDVRDIAVAYTKLALSPKLAHTTYNICSGKSMSGRQILDQLKEKVGKPDIKFEIDPSLVRPNDTLDIYGDSARLAHELDWKPHYTVNQTIADFVANRQS